LPAPRKSEQAKKRKHQVPGAAKFKQPIQKNTLTVALPITLKSYLRAKKKKNYGNSNISLSKNIYNLPKKIHPLKENQKSFKREIIIITLLWLISKFQHKPKYHHLSKNKIFI
jgi:hypothetical protein